MMLRELYVFSPLIDKQLIHCLYFSSNPVIMRNCELCRSQLKAEFCGKNEL